MPELPEVETVVRQLAARLSGAVVESVDLRRPDIVLSNGPPLSRRLPGSRIEQVTRRGKRIVFHLNRPDELIFHLGMSGRLTIESPDVVPAPHTHLRLGFVGRSDELRFRDPRRFGGVWLLPADCPTAKRLGPLGPDALTLSAARLRAVLAQRRQIKALLMDQQAVGGMGNIYCDEALFRAAIHPLSIAADLPDDKVLALARAIRNVLREAIRAGGSSFREYRDASGAPGFFQTRHRVYGREGSPCPQCGAAIVRMPIAGRSTHFCPKCQRRTRRKQTHNPSRKR